MAEIERLMRASAVQIKVEATDSADARFCLEGYFRELAERFETGFDPAKSISANVDELTPPAGVFVFARLGGQPIGCGALFGFANSARVVFSYSTAPPARYLGSASDIKASLAYPSIAMSPR